MKEKIRVYQCQGLLVRRMLASTTTKPLISGCTRREAKQLEWWLVGAEGWSVAQEMGYPVLQYGNSQFVGLRGNNYDDIDYQPLK